MKTLLAVALCLTAASSAYAQGSLPLLLLTKPLHVGDSPQKDMGNPNPDAATFQTKFRWNGSAVGDLYLIINVSHVVPKNSPEFQQGFYQTSVSVNGADLGILNKELRSRVQSPKPETIAMSLKAALLVQGENMLVIKPGGKDGDLDDMELHSISIDSKKPR